MRISGINSPDHQNKKPTQARRHGVQDTAKVSSGNHVQFFTQPDRNAYGANGPYANVQTGTASPDNISHKAQAAISEYLQTQFIEERLHFTEFLGIDDFA
jgi:hypothetical protein